MKSLLFFENTPLSDVILSMQKVYAKNVVITDDIAGKKFTAKLQGMPFDTAIEVICTSLDLEYSVRDNIYMLKDKGSE